MLLNEKKFHLAFHLISNVCNSPPVAQCPVVVTFIIR